MLTSKGQDTYSHFLSKPLMSPLKSLSMTPSNYAFEIDKDYLVNASFSMTAAAIL